MPYSMNYTDGTRTPITVSDGTTDTTTALTFVGKNYTGYAKILAENFLHLLENFASPESNEAELTTKAVPGQLWYDSTNSILKIYDGSNWKSAGGVTKSPQEPTGALLGDLWANTDTQQLFLYNGVTWILIGPEFSQSTKSGPKVEIIKDNNAVPVDHTIISFYITDNIVAIFATEEFTPKVVINGFTILKPGVNLSTVDFVGNGSVNKIWATAQAAESLIVGTRTVASSNFLRSDVASTTNFGLNVRSNSGITLGSDLTTSITTSNAGETIVYNKNEGSSIFIKTIFAGAINPSLTIFGNKVGINKSNPLVALDVVGAISATGLVNLTSTATSLDTTSGALVVAGGVGIGGVTRIAKDTYINGKLYLNSLDTLNNVAEGPAILPSTSEKYELGSSTKIWKTVYAKNVVATGTVSAQTFSGTFSGNVSGSANRLATPTAFKLDGDVTSNTISFTGQQPSQQAFFTTTISQDFIAGKDSALEATATDEMIINKPGVGLQKISKQTFFSNVPIIPAGAIFPFAGTADKVPTGYLLCDGSEQLVGSYPELFAVIGYTYKAIGLLIGSSTFALPDLRGRFPLGADNMTNGGVTYDNDGVTPSTTANRVTDITADLIGLSKGSESLTINLSNLPEHKHDMRGTAQNGTKGNQFYAIRDTSEDITDRDAQAYTRNGPDALNRGQFLPNSGGIQAPIGTNFSTPITLMNPYLTINYIIFTGRIL